MREQYFSRILCGLSLVFLSTACYQSQVQTDTTSNSSKDSREKSPPQTAVTPPDRPASSNTSPTENPSASSQEISFFCGSSYDAQSNRKLPTTFVRKPDRSKAKLIVWEMEFFTRSGYPPQERCQEVSPRFDEAYRSGSLDDYIIAGKMNEQPVICTAGDIGADCDRLLITLRPGDNSQAMLEHLGSLFTGRESGPIRHQSGTQQYYKIDIEEFLRTAEFEQE